MELKSFVSTLGAAAPYDSILHFFQKYLMHYNKTESYTLSYFHFMVIPEETEQISNSFRYIHTIPIASMWGA